MADSIFSTVIPPLKAVDNGDGTYSVAISGTILQSIIDSIGALQTSTETLQDIINKIGTDSDGLQSLTVENWIGRSLNDVFLGRIYNIASAIHEKPDIDKYWDEDGLTCPINYKWLSVISRSRFMYPTVTSIFTIPDLAAIGNDARMHWGLEAGADHNILDVKLIVKDSKAYFQMSPPGIATNLEVTALLPADYATVLHKYTIKANKSIFELYIDDVLKAVGLMGLPEAIPSIENVLPYAIGSCKIGAYGSFTYKIECGDVNGAAAFTFPLKMYLSTGEEALNRASIASGDPNPPRQYQVYTENTSTKWSTLAVPNLTTYNSHPFPVWGYENKTLVYKMTATLSTAKIQVYIDGGWEDLANLTVDGAIHYYDIAIEAPIARLVVTGGAGDGVVNKAQAYLR